MTTAHPPVTGLAPDELAPADQDPHYVRSVTELGEENEVVAQEDIFAANGMKLLAKGAKINRATWQRLTGHKLKTPLDLQLVIAYCLGMRMKLLPEQSRNLFLAALCHDFGEMHTDPLILAPGHRIDKDEQRFVYVHPLTGYIVLQQMNCVPADVMQAVRQHHERLDGSGYPYGEPEEKIGLLARIIAVSETLEAVLRRFGLQRVNIVLRLSQGRLDSDCLIAARELLPAHLQQSGDIAADFAPEKELTRLSNLMRTWSALREKMKDGKHHAALEFISGRIAALQWLALQAGLTPELLELLDLDGEDAGVMHELSAILEELNRLLDSLALEIDRRVPPAAHSREIADAILATLRPAVGSGPGPVLKTPEGNAGECSSAL